jgi:hypothetical protein
MYVFTTMKKYFGVVDIKLVSQECHTQLVFQFRNVVGVNITSEHKVLCASRKKKKNLTKR